LLLRARYYDPTIGRFISPDTIVPAPANPQSLNRYSYCLNNPLKYVDPSGLYYYDWYMALLQSHDNPDLIDALGGIDEVSRNLAGEIYVPMITVITPTFLLGFTHLYYRSDQLNIWTDDQGKFRIDIVGTLTSILLNGNSYNIRTSKYSLDEIYAFFNRLVKTFGIDPLVDVFFNIEFLPYKRNAQGTIPPDYTDSESPGFLSPALNYVPFQDRYQGPNPYIGLYGYWNPNDLSASLNVASALINFRNFWIVPLQ
jgi:hypothetical protein